MNSGAGLVWFFGFFYTKDFSDCLMFALKCCTNTHLGKHLLHFPPVLWLTVDRVIEGEHESFEQRNRVKLLLQ